MSSRGVALWRMPSSHQKAHRAPPAKSMFADFALTRGGVSVSRAPTASAQKKAESTSVHALSSYCDCADFTASSRFIESRIQPNELHWQHELRCEVMRSGHVIESKLSRTTREGVSLRQLGGTIRLLRRPLISERMNA